MLSWTCLLALVHDAQPRCARRVAVCRIHILGIRREGIVGELTNRGGVNGGWMVWVNLAKGEWFEVIWIMYAMGMVISYLTCLTTKFFIRGQCKPKIFEFFWISCLLHLCTVYNKFGVILEMVKKITSLHMDRLVSLKRVFLTRWFFRPHPNHLKFCTHDLFINIDRIWKFSIFFRILKNL